MRMLAHTHTHTHTHTLSLFLPTKFFSRESSRYVHIIISTYACVYMYISTYACVYVDGFVHILFMFTTFITICM